MGNDSEVENSLARPTGLSPPRLIVATERSPLGRPSLRAARVPSRPRREKALVPALRAPSAASPAGTRGLASRAHRGQRDLDCSLALREAGQRHSSLKGRERETARRSPPPSPARAHGQVPALLAHRARTPLSSSARQLPALPALPASAQPDLPSSRSTRHVWTRRPRRRTRRARRLRQAPGADRAPPVRRHHRCEQGGDRRFVPCASLPSLLPHPPLVELMKLTSSRVASWTPLRNSRWTCPTPSTRPSARPASPSGTTPWSAR